jgi:hypothetical protein
VSLPDVRLRAYLLGQLGEDQAEALEREYFTDAERRERLAAEEDDLFDQYATQRLAPEDRRRFEQKYLSSPQGRDRVAFARALHASAAARAAARPLARAAPWRVLAAAAALALVALGTWVVRYERAREAEVQRLRAAVGALSTRESEPRQLVEPAPAAAPQPTTSPGPVTTPPVRVATLELAPGLLRDRGALPLLQLPRGAESLRLRLRVNAELSRESYTARIETVDGRAVANLEPLRARPLRGDRVVDVLLSASLLDEEIYIVTLHGKAQHSTEELATYCFRVRRSV